MEGPSTNSLTTLAELLTVRFHGRVNNLIKQECWIILKSGSLVGKHQSLDAETCENCEGSSYDQHTVFVNL